MKRDQKIAFLFPGQGSQVLGMGQDFSQQFPIARQTFEEAGDILQRSIIDLIVHGPIEALTETKNSQVAIYVTSVAIARVIEELCGIKPSICSGLSLGEYSALTIGGWLLFSQGLPLVQYRGESMNEACERTKGTMAAIMGLDASVVEELVAEINLPDDLWIANFNCPGQVIVSGTIKGVESASVAAKKRNAKRVFPLQVHGAFHSGLMSSAMEKLAVPIEQLSIVQGSSQMVMNVPGDFVSSISAMRRYLVQQVVSSVRWEQGIRKIDEQGVDLYIEFGPGKTLSGMNKKIGVQAPTLSVEKIEDINQILTQI